MLRLNATKAVPGCPRPCGRISANPKVVLSATSRYPSTPAVTSPPARCSTLRSRAVNNGSTSGSSGHDDRHDRSTNVTPPPGEGVPVYLKPKLFESNPVHDPTSSTTPEQQHQLQAALADLAYKLTAAAAEASTTQQTSNTPHPHVSTSKAASSSSSGAGDLDAALSVQQITRILGDWADQYLTHAELQPSSQAAADPTAAAPSTVLKTLLDQLLQALLQKSDMANTPADVKQVGVGRSLAAAAAAAAAAGGLGSTTSKPLKVTHKPSAPTATGLLETILAPTDNFDPDVWEASAAAAAAAATDEAQPDYSITSSTASSSGDTKDTPASPPGVAPDVKALEYADRSSHSSSTCWPVAMLVQAVVPAAAAAQAGHSSDPRTHSTPNASAGVQLITITGQLLRQSATAAVSELLLLPPVDRAAVLLLLCSGSIGSRGEAWLCDVLGGVRERLGLLEMGLLLAAVHNRFGVRTFSAASRQLLPLSHPATDPLLSLTLPHSAPMPAAALQALLLHWLLLPQLAGLPVLPEQQVVLLLQDIVATSSSRQLQLTCRWGEVWPITQLAADPGSSSSSSSSRVGETWVVGGMAQQSPPEAAAWQLYAPCLDATLASNAWCGLTGIRLDQVAHVIIKAAKALLPDQHSSSSSCGGSGGTSRLISDTTGVMEFTAVARALIFGFRPLQPMLLLILHRFQQQLLPAAMASRKQQLLKVLLEAGSSSGSSLAAPSLAELINCSLSLNSSSSSRGELALINAAVSLLAGLTPDQLRDELLLLLDLQQQQHWATQGYCLATPDPENPYKLGPGVYQVLVGVAEAANPDQALIMLDLLPMPVWSAAWAVFVGPASGSFCWGSNDLATVLARLAAAAGGDGVAIRGSSAAASSSGSGRMEQLKAAWAVVAAHCALREVHGKLRQLGLSAASDAAAEHQQQHHLQEWTAGSSYTYQPGVPFVGDGWDQDTSSMAAAAVPAGTCFSGGLSSCIDRVVSGLAAPTAAMHGAALAAVLPADAFARAAAHILSPLISDLDGHSHNSRSSYTPWADISSSTSYTSNPTTRAAGQQHTTASPLLKSLANLHLQFPDLPRQPLATQLLAAVAPHLPLDQLPSFLAHSNQISKSLCDLPWIVGASPSLDPVSLGREVCDSSDPDQQRDLVIAAAAIGRDDAAVQHMLIMLVDQCPPDLACAAVAVLGGGVPEAVLLAAMQKLQKHDTSGSSSVPTGFEGEMVWQLGQTVVTPSAAAAAAAATEAVGLYGDADHWLVRRLCDIISDVPAAAPVGSWSMDAMQDRERVASLLQQLLSLLADWTPSCPAAAAAVGRLLTTLITKRSWSDAEAGAVLQRLQLPTALQLLLEGSSSLGSSSWIGRHRPKLLGSLIDWHGFGDTVDAIRALFVRYNGAGIADFAALLADLQPAVIGSNSSGCRGVWMQGATADSPNCYIAVLLHTVGLMKGLNTTRTQSLGSTPSPAAAAGSSVRYPAPAWSRQLSRILCLLGLLVPDHVVSHLAEQISISLVRSGEAESILAQSAAASSSNSSSTATDLSGIWHSDLDLLLADLPVAAAAVAGKGYELWGPVAGALLTGAAAAAGGTAVLPALRLACGSSTSTKGGQGFKQVAAHLPDILQQLQEQGALTCGVGSSSSSSTAATHPHNTSKISSDISSPSVSQCINLQLVLLLQQLHSTDKRISLSTAVTALLALHPTLGKALPQALVQVFGHPKACGYGGLNGVSGYNPDAAEAVEGLQASLQAAAAAVMPTGAAVSTAAAVAGKQLSEVLVYCHEMMSDQIMSDLVSAIAAVVPWDLAPSSSSSSSRDVGPRFYPAETWYDQDGWMGLTRLQLVTSSLLTAASATWGVDKGTHVAHSLMNKFLAVAAATGVGISSSSNVASSGVADQHSSTAVLEDNSSSSSMGSHGLKAKQALLKAAASGSNTSTTTSGSKSGKSTTHADRAQAALLRAAGRGGSTPATAATPAASISSSSSSGSHTRRAAEALLKAAASGAASAAFSHSALAQQKLITAAVGSGSSCGGSALLWAVRELTAAAGYIDSLGHPATDSGCSSAAAAAAASRDIVRQLLATGYSAITTSAAAAAGSSHNHAALAAALISAVSRVALPPELVVQVLVQCEESVSDQQWDQALAAAAVMTAGEHMGQQQRRQQQQLLEMLVQEVQLQVRVNARGPRIYAAVLAAAAAVAKEGSKLLTGDRDCELSAVLQPLLQLILTGSSSSSAVDSRGAHKGVALSGSAAAQMVLELVGISSMSSHDHTTLRNADDQQLVLLSQVLPAMLHHYSSSSSTGRSGNHLSLFVACIADRIADIADPMQQFYILLLLQPHLMQDQLAAAVAETPLAGSSGSSIEADIPTAAAALQQLCNNPGPGRKVSLASYAELLAAALDVTSSSSSSSRGVSYHEARVCLDLARQRQQQQLLAAVATVLGPFRGMRSPYVSNTAAAQLLLLPPSDLAAVLCYSQMLLPAATADRLAAAVAAAVAPDQLEKLLLLLPKAAVEGVGKGPELWRPLLHIISVAAGLADAAESDLAMKVADVAVEQGITAPVTIPCALSDRNPSAAGAAGAAAVRAHDTLARDSSQDLVKQLLDSAAVNAADKEAHAAATATAADTTPAAAAVRSHPISCNDQDLQGSDQESITSDLSQSALDTIAAVSLAVASTAAGGAVAAGYGAAGALVGLVWGAAALVAGSLAAADAIDHSSNGSSSSIKKITCKDASLSVDAGMPPETTAAAGGVASDESPPDSPKTPTRCEPSTAARAAAPAAPAAPAAAGTPGDAPLSDSTITGSSSSSGAGNGLSVMGGRTKTSSTVYHTPPHTSSDENLSTAAAANNTASTANEATPAYAAASSSSSGEASAIQHILGSLYVDEDEVICRIKTAAVDVPLDEAMMMVIPLLLQPDGSSSSSAWPLLAINAVLHTKHPALPVTVQGNMTAVNLAIAAALDTPKASATSSSSSSPLSLLLAAADAVRSRSLGFTTLDGGWQQQQQQQDAGFGDAESFEALLTAAEAVDPWAVSMQICSRVINALWDVLMGSCITGSSSSSSSGDDAAAAWQAVVTDLLKGTSPKVAQRFLSEFVSHNSSWEAALRALAVAAAVQDGTSSSSRSIRGQQESVFTDVLREVCSSRSHPPLAFLVLLLQQQQLRLRSSDVKAVLEAASNQLLATYGSPLAEAAGGGVGNIDVSTDQSSSGRSGCSSSGDFVDFTDGDFDFWGFEALFKDLDLFKEPQQHQQQQQQLEGPQYQPTSQFTASNSSSGSSVAANPIPAAAMDSIAAIVTAVISRGYSVEALDFIMCLLLLVDTQLQSPLTVTTSFTTLEASSSSSSSSSSRLVKEKQDAGNTSCSRVRGKAVEARLVLDHGQMRVLIASAADCCAAALEPASSGNSMLATALLPTAIPDLVTVLADYNDADSCAKLAAAVCEAYKRNHMIAIADQISDHIGDSRGQISKKQNLGQQSVDLSGSCSEIMPWVDARLVGRVVSAAAAAAAASDSSGPTYAFSNAAAATVGSSSMTVSAVKPNGSALLCAVSAGLFKGVSVEQCLVILAAVSAELPVKLGLQLVSASAAKLHSVMPQAVAIVRSSSSSKC